VYEIQYQGRKLHTHTGKTSYPKLLINQTDTCFLLLFLGPMPLFLRFNTQTMHFKSLYTQQHCYVSLKTLYPGGIRSRVFLFLRRMRCPLRHAARAKQTDVANPEILISDPSTTRRPGCKGSSNIIRTGSAVSLWVRIPGTSSVLDETPCVSVYVWVG
jgi:hypothetical protein